MLPPPWSEGCKNKTGEEEFSQTPPPPDGSDNGMNELIRYELISRWPLLNADSQAIKFSFLLVVVVVGQGTTAAGCCLIDRKATCGGECVTSCIGNFRRGHTDEFPLKTRPDNQRGRRQRWGSGNKVKGRKWTDITLTNFICFTTTINSTNSGWTRPGQWSQSPRTKARGEEEQFEFHGL